MNKIIIAISFFSILFQVSQAQAQAQDIDWSCYSPLIIPDLLIEKCQSDFKPKGGNEDNLVTITAKVNTPGLSGQFIFTLESSDEDGYCLNAPQNLPLNGEDSKNWADLQFFNTNGYQTIGTHFTISGDNNNIAKSIDKNLTEASVVVSCNDYGAFGIIRAVLIPDNGGTIIGYEEGGSGKPYTRIPLDDNENSIGDFYVGQQGLPTSDEPKDDNDNLPNGAGINGDGFSRFEEYRGFIVKNNHRRISQGLKDVFVLNKDVPNMIGDEYLNLANLTAPVHIINSNEIASDGSNKIAFNSSGFKVYEQEAIVVTNASYDEDQYFLDPTSGLVGGGEIYGLTYIPYSTTEAGIPIEQAWCTVDYNAHHYGATLAYTIGESDQVIYAEPPSEQWLANLLFNPMGGYTKIDDEIIRFSSFEIEYAPPFPTNYNYLLKFSGCERGANQTTASEHIVNPTANMFPVLDYFLEPDKVAQSTFAHEVGHLMGLIHTNTPTIMGPLYGGDIIGSGITQFVNGSHNDLEGVFRLKD